MSDFNLKLAHGKATDPLVSLQRQSIASDGPDGKHKLKEVAEGRVLQHV